MRGSLGLRALLRPLRGLRLRGAGRRLDRRELGRDGRRPRRRVLVAAGPGDGHGRRREARLRRLERLDLQHEVQVLLLEELDLVVAICISYNWFVILIKFSQIN